MSKTDTTNSIIEKKIKDGRVSMTLDHNADKNQLVVYKC